MNREDIIRMAREAGFATGTRDLADGIGSIQTVWPFGVETCLPNLERFAALVAAAEREACHALRQTLPNPHEHCQVSAHAYDMAIAAYGAAIRARVQP